MAAKTGLVYDRFEITKYDQLWSEKEENKATLHIFRLN